MITPKTRRLETVMGKAQEFRLGDNNIFLRRLIHVFLSSAVSRVALPTCKDRISLPAVHPPNNRS
jgi:hypothetical protein